MAYSSQENICNGNLVSQEKEEMVQVSLSFSKDKHLPSRVGLDVDDFCKLGAAFTRKSITCPKGHNSLTTANPRSKLHPPRSTTTTTIFLKSQPGANPAGIDPTCPESTGCTCPGASHSEMRAATRRGEEQQRRGSALPSPRSAGAQPGAETYPEPEAAAAVPRSPWCGAERCYAR